MKNRKELLPAQRRFLEYIRSWRPNNESFALDRIQCVLKSGDYRTGGGDEKYFNWLRENYISDFYDFESSYTPVTVGGTGGWFDCITIHSEFDSELNEWYEEITK